MEQEAHIIRSKRKTLAMEIRPDGTLVVRAPLRLPQKEIARFVQSHAAWVERKRKEMAARPQPVRHAFLPGEAFRFLGQKCFLRYSGGKEPVALKGDVLVVPALPREQLRSKIIAWYRAQARLVLKQRLDGWARKTGLCYSGLRITSAKTRWGSCTGKNVLSFPFFLVMAPPEVIDSVVVHELCHTRFHNHSSQFWQLVHSVLPDYDARHRWLMDNGLQLRLEEAAQ